MTECGVFLLKNLTFIQKLLLCDYASKWSLASKNTKYEKVKQWQLASLQNGIGKIKFYI